MNVPLLITPCSLRLPKVQSCLQCRERLAACRIVPECSRFVKGDVDRWGVGTPNTVPPICWRRCGEQHNGCGYLVAINRMLEHPHISVVQNDLHRGAQAAVEHLISLGHRAIGMLAGLYLEVGGHYRARYQGYLDALAQASITFQPEWVVLSEPVISAGQQAARELLTALLVFAGLQTIP